MAAFMYVCLFFVGCVLYAIILSVTGVEPDLEFASPGAAAGHRFGTIIGGGFFISLIPMLVTGAWHIYDNRKKFLTGNPFFAGMAALAVCALITWNMIAAGEDFRRNHPEQYKLLQERTITTSKCSIPLTFPGKPVDTSKTGTAQLVFREPNVSFQAKCLNQADVTPTEAHVRAIASHNKMKIRNITQSFSRYGGPAIIARGTISEPKAPAIEAAVFITQGTAIVFYVSSWEPIQEKARVERFLMQSVM